MKYAGHSWWHRSQLIPVFMVAFALTIGIQWHNNAFAAEWSDTSDEAAHYVTGLLVHDYILQGLPTAPMEYAQRYYEYYPYIGLGHFPPVFYLVQAAWTIPLGISRTSLLSLIAMINAGLLTTTYIVGRRYFPVWLCWALVGFLATVPAMQIQSRMLIADGLVALLSFWSLLAFERYLKSPTGLMAAGFGLLAAITILTKGTGLALAPIPVLAALAMPRRTSLTKSSFWFPAIVVLLICGPWFLFIPDALHDRVARFGGIHFLPSRIPESAYFLSGHLSWIGALLAALGAGIVFSRPKKAEEQRDRTFWSVALLFFVSTFAFRMTIGAWEVRHLLNLMPFLTLFMGAGLWWIVSRVFRSQPAGIIVVLVTLGAIGAVNVMGTIPKKRIGLDKVVQDLVADPRFTTSRLLILSDSVGEGAFVAEVAMRERRPGHLVERGSKLLATNSFMGDRYELNYATPEAALAFLEQGPSRVVILDSPTEPPPHVDLIRETVAANASRWSHVASYMRENNGRQNSEIQVFALRP
jgi:MFS family permease